MKESDMMSIRSIKELIEQFEAANEDEDTTNGRGVIEAQAMELRTRMTPYLANTCVFNPGDMVRSTHGLQMIEGEPDLAMMFVRYLDDSDKAFVAALQETTAMPNVNCIVAFLSDTGRTVVMLPYESRRLEIDPRV